MFCPKLPATALLVMCCSVIPVGITYMWVIGRRRYLSFIRRRGVCLLLRLQWHCIVTILRYRYCVTTQRCSFTTDKAVDCMTMVWNCQNVVYYFLINCLQSLFRQEIWANAHETRDSISLISAKIHSKCAPQPKIAKNSLKTPILWFKVVQGHGCWYHWKARR